MGYSGRLTVRAGADIVVSLLLGTDLVLFLVWLANRLDLAEPEVAFLRGTLERAGTIADLPWWLWLALYLLLAGASLAFAVWPTRFSAISRWSERLRVVPSVDVSKRVLTGVHIGLLTTVLIGLAAPPALAATLQAQLKTRYTVALQRQLEADGELAAYEEIRSQFSTLSSRSPTVRPLADIVAEIHDISTPPPGSDDATSTERDLANSIGQLQETTLELASPGPIPSAKLSEFETPVRDAGDLQGRLDRLGAEQQEAGSAESQAERAADLAAAAVAGAIQIPHLGSNEVVQIISDYLSGLIESGPLKAVFTSWVQRLTRATPLSADQIVVPDPRELEETALSLEKSYESIVEFPDAVPDTARSRAESKSPAAAAVDLVNETRYLQEGSGPCQDCPPLPRASEEQYQPQEEINEQEEPPQVVEP